MNRLAALPYSYKSKEFIDKFRKLLLIQRTTYEIPKPMYNKEGRMYVTTYGEYYSIYVISYFNELKRFSTITNVCLFFLFFNI